MPHKYKLKYNLSSVDGEFTKEDLDQMIGDDIGGTDALLVFSILYPDDGSFSTQMFSIDGCNNKDELSDNEIFKVWSNLSYMLANSKNLSRIKKEISQLAFDSVREFVVGIKPND